MNERKPERRRLSRGEWALMKVCWRRGRATAREIHEASPEGARREYRTTKTMLDRMEAKGWLRVTRVGPVRVYEPAVGRSEGLRAMVRDFVEEVLDHRLGPLFAHFAEDAEALADEDLALLRRLLEKREGAGGEPGSGRAAGRRREKGR